METVILSHRLPTYANFNVSFDPKHLALVDYFPLVKHNQILPKADLFLYGWYNEKEYNCFEGMEY